MFEAYLAISSVFFFGFLLLSAAFAARAESAAQNVVLILSDDQHWRDYGFMGHEHLQDTTLDRLASESLVFLEAMSLQVSVAQVSHH